MEQGLDFREGEELSWCPSWSNSLWQGWSCGLVYCPGGNATDLIWRVLASSLGISSWTPLKPQHSNPNPNSNCCCSCWFEPEIIKICQSSHKVYRNNMVNFQESTTILNGCTKKGLGTYWMHHVVQPDCQGSRNSSKISWTIWLQYHDQLRLYFLHNKCFW